MGKPSQLFPNLTLLLQQLSPSFQPAFSFSLFHLLVVRSTTWITEKTDLLLRNT